MGARESAVAAGGPPKMQPTIEDSLTGGPKGPPVSDTTPPVEDQAPTPPMSAGNRVQRASEITPAMAEAALASEETGILTTLSGNAETVQAQLLVVEKQAEEARQRLTQSLADARVRLESRLEQIRSKKKQRAFYTDLVESSKRHGLTDEQVSFVIQIVQFSITSNAFNRG